MPRIERRSRTQVGPLVSLGPRISAVKDTGNQNAPIMKTKMSMPDHSAAPGSPAMNRESAANPGGNNPFACERVGACVTHKIPAHIVEIPTFGKGAPATT